MRTDMTLKLASLGLIATLAACGSTNTARDQGIDNHALEAMAASVWVDPDGCKHWVIDDNVEGYMSPVLNLDGTPDCA